ncbi:hypothetical protein [Oryzobacter terrae]|uniref:hypothetical protein n=1 Tax=Oryzobacter terrae TaxID=1620385 RepID=UPI00366B0021
MARADRTGLSLGYRIGWRLRYAAMSVFGPAQLGTDDDPQMKLRREKQSKVEAARRAREAHPAA